MTDSDKKDLTRLEDLSEFLHQDDPDADEVFKAEEKPLAPPSLPDEPPLFDEITESNELPDLPQGSGPFHSDSDSDSESEAFPQEFSVFENENTNEGFSDLENELSGLINTDDNADFASKIPADVNEFPELDLDVEAEFEADSEDEKREEEIEETIKEEKVARAETPLPVSPRAESQNFLKEIKEFGESISFGTTAKGGNPPYGLIIREIQYKEDAEEIFEILKSMKLVRSDNENIIHKSLKNGAIYLSQLSEYMGILLAHKLRRFEVDILFGLADELRPSPTETLPQKGLVSRDEVHLNFTVSKEWRPNEQKLEAENIIISTSPYLENYIVKRHLGVVSEQKIIPIEDLKLSYIPKKQAAHQKIADIMAHNIQIIYEELKDLLKNQAIEKGGNGILGLNYHVSPLQISTQSSRKDQKDHYQVTALGNLVWLSDGPNIGQ